MTKSSSKKDTLRGIPIKGIAPSESKQDTGSSKSDDVDPLGKTEKELFVDLSTSLPVGVSQSKKPQDLVPGDQGYNRPKSDPILNSTLPDEKEAHDAWTVDHMARRSSFPPIRSMKSTDILFTNQSSSTPPPLPAAANSQIDDLQNQLKENRSGSALDLVGRTLLSHPAVDLREEMEELFALGEFSGALRLAELILGTHPDDEQALLCATRSRSSLESKYKSKIGPLSQIPVLAMNDSEIRWLGLDHRAGFVLSRIDCRSSIDELLDVCGMPHLEVLKTIIELFNRGAIEFRTKE